MANNKNNKNNNFANNKKISKINDNKKAQSQKYLTNLQENGEEATIKKEAKKRKKEKALATRSRKQKIIRSLIAFLIIATICLIVFLPLYLTGTLDKIHSLEDLKSLIQSGGGWSAFIFGALQFLQVTFLPIPAIVTTVAGSIIFGPLYAFLISFVAVMLGSLFSFWFGKKVGKKVVAWIVGTEETEKWSAKLEKGKYVFFLMMLFPVFPDDVLCMVVGLTNMSYKFFIITNLITRPIGIATTCYFGSGTIIPFSGWGIYVWIALILVGIAAFYIAIRYESKIENFINCFSIKQQRKKDYKKRLKQASSNVCSEPNKDSLNLNNEADTKTENNINNKVDPNINNKNNNLDINNKNSDLDVNNKNSDLDVNNKNNN